MSEAISNVYRDITLDLYNTDSSPVTVKAVQGDTSSRFLNVLLTNAGELYSPDDEAHAQLFVIKPDGYVVYNNGTIESDTITFELTNQILAVPGKCKCQVLLWDRDYEQVLRTATPLVIDIAEKLDDESAIASTNEYGVLEDILQEIEEGGRITDNNFTDAYRAKLDMVNENAEPNQNAFSKLIVQGTSLSAGQESDSVQMSIGEGLVVGVVEGANAFQLSVDLPDASELERGLLTPADYIRFSNMQSGDHTIKEVTATAVTIELSDSTEVSLLRADGSEALTLDNIYPVGSLFVTNQRGGYPSIGTWHVFDVELVPYFTTFEYDNGNSWAINEGGHSVHHILIRAVPNTITGECDGEPHYIGALACRNARLTTIADKPVYVSGFIYADEETVPHAALFRVDPGSTAGIYIERWTGSLIADSKAYFSFTSVANRYTILPGTTSTTYEIVTYKRVA